MTDIFSIATRGSALALAQANDVLSQCRTLFPRLQFELKIIKTTGDKLQTAPLTQENKTLPKGLFTKELEVALLKHHADLAVHSLKDLPTQLPAGLKLAAVGKRADVRDVLVYRDAAYLDRPPEPGRTTGEWSPGHSARRGFKPHLTLSSLPGGSVVATSSTRRKAQVLEQNPKLTLIDIRGNIVTRLQKLMDNPDMDATLLAAAGLARLNFRIGPACNLEGDAVPEGLLATVLETDTMLPCVGQGAIGIEIREGDERLDAICQRLNHYNTRQCVTAERAFLAAMGGGCQSPLAACAEATTGDQLRLRAVSFFGDAPRRAEALRPINEAVELGRQLAEEMKS